MKTRYATLLALLPVLVWGISVPLSADEADDRDAIYERFPGLDDSNLRPSPVRGLYEMVLDGRVLYVSADGRYVLQGDLFDVDEEVNLTETRRSAARLDAVSSVSESSMIVFEPENALHTITVFTDIDCGYCRKLHRQMDEYNAEGIRVRYLFFPRSGPDTESWSKADNVWCAADRNTAMTRAKAGENVVSDECGVTPVDQHYQLGKMLGIRGTPAIVTESGDLIPGYIPPPELVGFLNGET
ncbi:MAG: thioredoxin fold domain-containing protein [Gammaproteobacteria bacterium]|nr:thioredoxin fold domain-containing protein [Gammaproteobacteria bacterium]